MEEIIYLDDDEVNSAGTSILPGATRLDPNSEGASAVNDNCNSHSCPICPFVSYEVSNLYKHVDDHFSSPPKVNSSNFFPLKLNTRSLEAHSQLESVVKLSFFHVYFLSLGAL